MPISNINEMKIRSPHRKNHRKNITQRRKIKLKLHSLEPPLGLAQQQDNHSRVPRIIRVIDP